MDLKQSKVIIVIDSSFLVGVRSEPMLSLSTWQTLIRHKGKREAEELYWKDLARLFWSKQQGLRLSPELLFQESITSTPWSPTHTRTDRQAASHKWIGVCRPLVAFCCTTCESEQKPEYVAHYLSDKLMQIMLQNVEMILWILFFSSWLLWFFVIGRVTQRNRQLQTWASRLKN